MIRLFHQFCATSILFYYLFRVCTVFIQYYHKTVTPVSQGIHSKYKYECADSAAIYWPSWMLLVLMIVPAPTLPQIINQKGDMPVMFVLHGIKVKRLTLSCLWWDCTVGYAEWSHPATCLSWCRNLQTCRSAGRGRKKKKKEKEKHSRQRYTICLKVPLQNVTLHVINLLPLAVIQKKKKHTWFLSDMRKSSLDPGRPNSIKVFTSRRSALFPGSKEEIIHTLSLWLSSCKEWPLII